MRGSTLQLVTICAVGAGSSSSSREFAMGALLRRPGFVGRALVTLGAFVALPLAEQGPGSGSTIITRYLLRKSLEFARGTLFRLVFGV